MIFHISVNNNQICKTTEFSYIIVIMSKNESSDYGDSENEMNIDADNENSEDDIKPLVAVGSSDYGDSENEMGPAATVTIESSDDGENEIEPLFGDISISRLSELASCSAGPSSSGLWFCV